MSERALGMGVLQFENSNEATREQCRCGAKNCSGWL